MVTGFGNYLLQLALKVSRGFSIVSGVPDRPPARQCWGGKRIDVFVVELFLSHSKRGQVSLTKGSSGFLYAGPRSQKSAVLQYRVMYGFCCWA